MSFSSIITLGKTIPTSSTVYLSPSKRQRPPSPLKPIVSAQEIYKWTFHSDAVALCTVKDVHSMSVSIDPKYTDFYWIGSVPCRTVKVVGLVVGVQIYEKRILYLVDDGSGVIECYHAQYKEKQASKPQKQVKAEPDPPPVPIADLGNSVEVIGAVREVHNSRQIAVTSIKICSSPNEELRHARTVRILHQTKYASSDPFVIPQAVSTPRKPIVPITPSTLHSSPPSSVSSSPIKPEHIEQNFKSPIKLRHPSRLHTQDFTENTFRIYLKHYMDHASDITDISNEGHKTHLGLADPTVGFPSTPTKVSRSDKTPRQSNISRDFEATPRPHIPSLHFGQPNHPSAGSLLPESSRKGYTLSFLRRVPELSLLATKVVHAVGRRRMRDEKQKLKEAGTVPSRSEKSRIMSLADIPPDKVARKTKRLYEWAINRLHQDGCIVIWDGPVRPCPETLMMDTTRLWKTNTSILVDDSNFFSTTVGSNSSAFGTHSTGDGSLSDPDSNEEAYITLTSDYLAGSVEKAVATLVDHYEKAGKPYAGATKDGILAVLKKDDRWRYVGAWHIEDALDLLQREGKIWSLAKGRWDLTG